MESAIWSLNITHISTTPTRLKGRAEPAIAEALEYPRTLIVDVFRRAPQGCR
jgi:hypothetical protein